MKVLVAGGTGFIGGLLVRRLIVDGHQATVLTRNPSGKHRSIQPALEVVGWDASSLGPWASRVPDVDAVINLVGEPIGEKRWTNAQKERISRSRIGATRALVEAIGQAKRKPTVLVNASAVGYYGNTGEEEVCEDHPKGTGFLADLCERWEQEAKEAVGSGVRTVLLRTGIVLGERGGVLRRMVPAFKFLVGGPLGSGTQWFPWIHRDDVIGVILFTLSAPGLSGPANLVAPQSVTMGQFCSELGRVLHRPSWLRVPGFALRLAFGEMAGMMLEGQRVVPSVLRKSGYPFRYPTLRSALEDTVGSHVGITTT